MDEKDEKGAVVADDSDVSAGGRFGTWVVDEFGLPAFSYQLDQFNDPVGTWNRRLPMSQRGPDGDEGLSTLHWHQLGNDRHIAITTDAGWVQLYSHEYGPRWINMHRPELRSYAGGLSYVEVDGHVVSTLYCGRKDGVEVDRRWGCSYSRWTVWAAGIELRRTVFAPFGDSPFLVALVRIKNLSSAPRTLQHLEYWDLHLHDLDYTGPSFWQTDHKRRDALSLVRYRDYTCAWDDTRRALIATHPWREIIDDARNWPGGSQRVRPDVSLVNLGADAPQAITERGLLFADGDPASPSLFSGAAEIPGQISALPLLGLLTEHYLAPGAEVELAYAYGATPANETEGEIDHVRRSSGGALFRTSMQAWKSFLPEVELYDAALNRELVWSAYYLRSGAVYHRTLQAHTLPQGGAYQYIGGVNAGPRATLQHMLPLIWLDPALGKEALRSTLTQTHPSGEIPYAEVGNGTLDALKYIPSDNDLWLLWAVSDHVLATRDRQFLREVCSYWPAPYSRPEPVWDHCVRAFHHLIDEIGYGTHGLLRVRTSDWNDGWINENDIPLDQIWREGESTLNSAMAVHVLRRFAELGRYNGMGHIADEASGHANRLADAVRRCWRDGYLNRGWVTAELEKGHMDLYLEPQPWALITDILSPDQRRTLVELIDARLADPLGSRIFGAGGEEAPSAERTSVERGGIWPSINSTLVWGLGRVDPARAWRELRANTLHNHARTYPETWSGVWSGPDCYLYSTSERPGEAFVSLNQSMQAWPVQVLFPHSETLNGTLWLLGVEASADGLSIDPRLPFGAWRWTSRTLDIAYDAVRIAVSFDGLGAEMLPITVTLPPEWRGESVVVETDDGERERLDAVGLSVRVLVPVAGRRAGFTIHRLPEGQGVEGGG